MPVRLSEETERAKYNISQCETIFVNGMCLGVTSLCCVEQKSKPLPGDDVTVTKISRATTLITKHGGRGWPTLQDQEITRGTI